MTAAPRRLGTFLVLPAAALALSLSACGAAGSSAQSHAAPAQPAAQPKPAGHAGSPLHRQADTLEKSTHAAEPAAAHPSTQRGQGKVCTTDPADRAACTFPKGAHIRPNGGDVNGDGVFQRNEPVGPGYKDPRAYDGGKTSGETQCEFLRKQGHTC